MRLHLVPPIIDLLEKRVVFKCTDGASYWLYRVHSWPSSCFARCESRSPKFSVVSEHGMDLVCVAAPLILQLAWTTSEFASQADESGLGFDHLRKDLGLPLILTQLQLMFILGVDKLNQCNNVQTI